jgi:hypothetical protein
MLEQAQLDQWVGTTDPLFVGPGLYGEIEKHIAETRPVVGYVLPDGTPCEADAKDAIALQEEHPWEKDAVAPMICGREVYCNAWTPAPSQEERDNAITLQEVLGSGGGHYAEGVEVGFIEG